MRICKTKSDKLELKWATVRKQMKSTNTILSGLNKIHKIKWSGISVSGETKPLKGSLLEFMEGRGRGSPPCLLCAILHMALVSAH